MIARDRRECGFHVSCGSKNFGIVVVAVLVQFMIVPDMKHADVLMFSSLCLLLSLSFCG